MKALNWIIGILLLVSLIFNGLQFYYIRHLDAPECVYVSDTVTIHTDSIITKTKWKTKFDTIIDVQYKDTILHDTIYMPIEHKVSEFELKKDSFELKQKIHHSGWHTNIDSVECSYTLNYEIMKPKPKKFGWCITFGPSVNFGINLDIPNKTFNYGPSAGFSVTIGPSYIIK